MRLKLSQVRVCLLLFLSLSCLVIVRQLLNISSNSSSSFHNHAATIKTTSETRTFTDPERNDSPEKLIFEPLHAPLSIAADSSQPRIQSEQSTQIDHSPGTDHSPPINPHSTTSRTQATPPSPSPTALAAAAAGGQKISFEDGNATPPFLGTTHKSSSPVSIFVMSYYANLAARQTIRETWASGHDNVYFVIGVPCPIPKEQRDQYFCERSTESPSGRTESTPKEQSAHDEESKRNSELVDEEQLKNHDLIRISDVTEVYRHLPHKLKAAFHWGITNTNSQFFVKTDDDSFIRVDTISNDLIRTYDSNVPMLIGNIKPHAIVDHTGQRTSGKNKEFNYKPNVYPPWAAGNSGYSVTRPIAQFISDERPDLFEYQGEDTSLGIWLDEGRLKNKVKFVTSKRFAGSLHWEGKCGDKSAFFIGHNILPETMRACYKLMDEAPGATEALLEVIKTKNL